MLKYDLSAFNNSHNLLCRYYKKILNQVDLSIKLRYFLEKEIFMEYPTNILQSFLWQPKERIFDSNIICDRHENTCQKSQRIYQNVQRQKYNRYSTPLSTGDYESAELAIILGMLCKKRENRVNLLSLNTIYSKVSPNFQKSWRCC